jgi:putative phosphoesterase
LKKIAIFSDVHSNIHALTKVLEDIENQEIKDLFCLGDLVGYGPHPNEVIERIRSQKIPTIMGNYDDGIGFEKGTCGCAYTSWEEIENGNVSIEWTTQNTSRENKKFLQGLLNKIDLKVEGKKVLLVHGSPRRINEYLYEDRPEKSIKRIVESIDIDVLGCAHTHIPYHRKINDIHVVNPGSVGKPKDGDPRACYALIEVGENVKVFFRRVEYPVEKVAKKIVKVGLPIAYAEDLRNAGK